MALDAIFHCAAEEGWTAEGDEARAAGLQDGGDVSVELLL